jgi:hypothetical protein
LVLSSSFFSFVPDFDNKALEEALVWYGMRKRLLVGEMSDIFRATDLFCNFLTWAKIWMVIKVAHHCSFKSHQLVAVIKLYSTNKTMRLIR